MPERDPPLTSPWILRFSACDPSDERRREALLAQGNGVLLVRAAAPWVRTDEGHYPGTYHAGIYDALASEIAGETMVETSLVNLPNWLPLDMRPANGIWLAEGRHSVLDYIHEIDLKTGLMTRRLRVRDAEGRETLIGEERMVSMAAAQTASLRLAITPLNWSGTLEIRSGLDADIINDNVPRYRDYANRHLKDAAVNALPPDLLVAEARLMSNEVRIAVATRTTLPEALQPPSVERSTTAVSRTAVVSVLAGAQVIVDKLAAICAGLDASAEAALSELAGQPGYQTRRERHTEAWAGLWSRCAPAASDSALARPLHFHLFHLLQTYSPNSVGRDLGLPARGWQEAYRGHVFWDELSALPFMATHFPELSREMLLYRYRRLDAARLNAQGRGLGGALFPWRSARTGAEETPRFQKNPKNGRWHRDHTYLQVHINAAIAWNICRYAETTGDEAFLAGAGREMLVEIARCLASLARPRPGEGRYDIAGIVGPDEYHTAYPGAATPGIDNNAYTNLMTAWTLKTAGEIVLAHPGEAQVDAGELAQWDEISRRLYLPITADGIVAQFEGFEALEPLNWESLDGGSIDWQLDAEGRDVNRYKVSKQADFAMLAYLFPPDDLIDLIARLGYAADRQTLRRSLDFALQHTSHGSSLSRVAYAGAYADLDPATSWRCYHDSLGLELDPANREDSREGVHLGAMAGTLDVLQRIYLGVRVRPDGIEVKPRAPGELGPVQLPFTCRFGAFRLDWDGKRLRIASARDNVRTCLFFRQGEEWLEPGRTLELAVCA